MTPEQTKTLAENFTHEMTDLAQSMINVNHCFEEEIFIDTNEMENAYWQYFRSTKEPNKDATDFFRKAKDAQFRFMHYAKKIRNLAGENGCTSDLAELFHAASVEHDEWQLARDDFLTIINDSEKE